MIKTELLEMISKECPGATPLYLVIRGSHSYGTNIPESDIDYGGVFIQGLDDILGNKYVEQINDDNNDVVIYEIRRFLELLAIANPSVLELLFTPEDCVIYKHPLFDELLEMREEFITKMCFDSIGGYARQQIYKAKGMNKMQNWEANSVARKAPIDFCYIHIGTNSYNLKEYLLSNNIDQLKCGLSKIPHSVDLYTLYYDDSENHRFRGLCFEDSNQLRLSSIPKSSTFGIGNNIKDLGYISYSKDAYTQHCSSYKKYQDWLTKRNTERWVSVKNHGQQIDGKNLLHATRLSNMSREIAEGKGLNVRRDNRDYLISIRKGEVNLQELIDNIEIDMKEINSLKDSSNLPDSVDSEKVNEILIRIRRSFYNI